MTQSRQLGGVDNLFTDCCYGTEHQHTKNQSCPQSVSIPTELLADTVAWMRAHYTVSPLADKLARHLPHPDDALPLDVRGIALAAIKRARQAGESEEMLARWISEDVHQAHARFKRGLRETEGG